MYILVQHTMIDPGAAWARAQEALGSLPEDMTLHHCIPAVDGRRAICVWETSSVDHLRDYLDPVLGPGARNEYSEAVNKEGVAVPPAHQAV